MRVWLCEKSDQAKNLAPLLGNPKPARGYIDTNDGRVTWAIGHLLQQAQPEQYEESWGQWAFSSLPMLPEAWKLLPDPNKQQQLDTVVAALKGATEVVIATDCGQEGEAIARELLDFTNYRGAIRRMWYSALDEASLRKALSSLREDAASRPMYWAAQARARADWLIGMNLSRAYTLRARAAGLRDVRSVGRVQTPALALVVRRDREIENFQVQTFYDIEAHVSTALGEQATLRYSPPEAERILDRKEAEAIAQGLVDFQAPLRVEQNERTQSPPKLLNLTRFSAVVGKKLGWKSDKALEVAQSLYDKGVTTYPRTACTLLPNEQESGIPAVLEAIGKLPGTARHVGALMLSKPTIRPAVFNTAKIEKDAHEHHAIIPTAVDATTVDLTDDERAAHLLIAQHYLAALLPDYRFAETRFTLEHGPSGVTKLTAVGRVPLEQGWRSVFGQTDPEEEADGEDAGDAPTLPAIADGTRVTVNSAAIKPRKTTPPKRYTDTDLMQDMESVAKFATDPAIKARLKETSGIGTVATRTSIIKTLRTRNYLADQGRYIVSTALGRELVDGLPAHLTDPATTAVWEERLELLRKGELPETERDTFVTKIAGNVAKLIDHLRNEAQAAAAARTPSEAQIKYANTIAATLGVAMPADVATSYSALQAFIEAHKEAYQANVASQPPSPAQLAFAEKVATEKGIELPPDVRTSRTACGAWLDANAPKTKPKADSGKAPAKKAAKKRASSSKKAGA